LRLGQRLGAAQGFIGHAQIAAGRDQGRGGLGQIRDLHGVEHLALAHVVARAHGHLTDAALVGREHLHRLVLVQIDDADGLALLGKGSAPAPPGARPPARGPSAARCRRRVASTGPLSLAAAGARALSL
jgi:hypothetical protein